MKSIIVPARNENLNRIVAFVGRELENCSCPPVAQMQIELAIEEIFVNIASYAYHPVEGEAEIHCEIEEDPLQVVIEFLDGGKPYDPLAREDADLSEEALISRTGGLGIFLVKDTMDDVAYRYEGGKNILTIRKRL